MIHHRSKYICIQDLEVLRSKFELGRVYDFDSKEYRWSFDCVEGINFGEYFTSCGTDTVWIEEVVK